MLAIKNVSTPTIILTTITSNVEVFKFIDTFKAVSILTASGASSGSH